MTRGACVHCGGASDSTQHDFRNTRKIKGVHQYEPAQEIDAGDQCQLCDDPECTGDFSAGQTCPLAFDHGAIMPNGKVRQVVVQESNSEEGKFWVKPVPGQILTVFWDKDEAERVAASWNACAGLTLEQIAAVPEALEFVRDFVTLTSAKKLREAYTAAGMSPDMPLALLKRAKAVKL